MRQIKSQEVDIIVGIPTLNERDCIANTVKKMDKGLIKYFPNYRSLIVNIDSKSTDRTGSIFLSTPTKVKKILLVDNSILRGKGRNIFLLLKLSKRLGAKYMIIIDADITTITEEWPKLFLDPIIHRKADFVAPIYTRNRYEGNTTNHFCFPILYAWFGKQLNQPIGGDFGMNNHFVDYVLKQRKSKNTFLYGIDIFLSTHALGANFKITEVYLGRKIHKPSFGKIITMFKQVSVTMLIILSQYRKQRNIIKPNITIENKQRIDFFIKKPYQINITYLKKYAFQSLLRLPKENIYKYLGLNSERVELIQKDKILISEDEWVKILANLLDHIHKYPMSKKIAEKVTTTLTPFFFLRILSYFEELKQEKRQEKIDALISDQAEKLKRLYYFKNS